MKKLIITTVLLATLTAVNAQEGTKAEMGKAPAAHSEKAYDTWAATMELTPEQSEKASSIFARFDEQMLEVNKAGLDEAGTAARAQVLIDSRDRDLKEVLTPEQYAKHKEMQAPKKAAPKKATNSLSAPQSK